MELCAEQGAFVTQETRSHSREENGNYFGALPSPPQALPMLTPGGINAGRLSACLHPCHRTLALTSSLTAMPVLCSRHTHQSRWESGGYVLKNQSNAADEGLPKKHCYLHICSQHQCLYPPPQNTFCMFPRSQTHMASTLCSTQPFDASPSPICLTQQQR